MVAAAKADKDVVAYAKVGDDSVFQVVKTDDLEGTVESIVDGNTKVMFTGHWAQAMAVWSGLLDKMTVDTVARILMERPDELGDMIEEFINKVGGK
jgi:hypothetical protein